MATYYVDPGATTNGTGSEASPYNTFSGLTWGANTYLIKRGTTLSETITMGAGSNGCIISCYGPTSDPLPIIDCGNSRSNGVDFNSKTGCEVSWLRVINQNAAPSSAGIKVTGSLNKAHHCETYNCQVGIHENSGTNNKIYLCTVDVGNSATLSGAYGIRSNSSTGSRIYQNRVISTVVGMEFLSTIQVYGGTGIRVYNNDVAAPMGDGPSLFNRSTGCYLVGNFVHGTEVLDGLICHDSDSNFIWNNTVVHLGDVEGHFGPAFKMGDNFGAGLPANLNSVRNNIFIMLGDNKVMSLSVIGTGNTVNNNILYSAQRDEIVNLDEGGGLQSLTFAEFQAEGYEANGFNFLPELSDDGGSLSAAEVLGVGADLGYFRDALGRKSKKHIGAFGAARLLAR